MRLIMEKKCENCKYKVERTTDKTIEVIKNLVKLPQTNRQWLESLSDEELAGQIAVKGNIVGSCEMCYFKNGCAKSTKYIELTQCLNGIELWLQSEHKE